MQVRKGEGARKCVTVRGRLTCGKTHLERITVGDTKFVQKLRGKRSWEMDWVSQKKKITPILQKRGKKARLYTGYRRLGVHLFVEGEEGRCRVTERVTPTSNPCGHGECKTSVSRTKRPGTGTRAKKGD